MALSIRPATEADLPTIQALAHATWPHTFKDILSAAQIDYMLAWLYALPLLTEQIRTKGHVFHLAQDGDTPEGYVCHQLDHPEIGVTKIHKLYVLPGMQGRGLGRALLDCVSVAAQQSRQNAITLNVNKYNRAQAFYRKQGFVQVGAVDIDIGGGYRMDDFVMLRTLGRVDACSAAFVSSSTSEQKA